MGVLNVLSFNYDHGNADWSGLRTMDDILWLG